VRSEFFPSPPAAPGKPFRLLVTGGQPGALPINRVFVDAMDRWRTKDTIGHRASTGERELYAVRTGYARREIHAGLSPSHDMAETLCLG